MTKGIKRTQLALMAGATLAFLVAILISSPAAHGISLEAGGVEMTLDLADTGLQLKFVSAG